MTAAEVCRLAKNLARNCGYAVFPVGEDKRARLKRWPDRASTDAAAIERLWREHPGPLIGIVTGNASGISVLDVDQKHVEAVLWWQDNHMLLPTRTYSTRSGGLHLFFHHRDGVTNSQNKICRGVDTRGEGGYAISWFAHGLDCLDHSPPQPWPAWLFDELTRRPVPQSATPARACNDDPAIDGIVRRLASAREGERNGVLFWAACRCAERGMRQGAIEELLIPAAIGIGLPDIEAHRTIGSAAGRAAA
jgi:hypothetical protein